MTVPSGWTVSLLDDVAVRGSGHTPDQRRADYWDGDIEWVSLADSGQLDAGYINTTARRISSLGVSHSSAVLHPAETVVMSRDAGVGKLAVLARPMAVSQHFIAWDCESKGSMSPWFLYYLLQSQKSYFERMAVGSTIKTIGLPLFKRLTVTYPPLPEQRKIAEILRTWDDAIDWMSRSVAAQVERRGAIVARLIFGEGAPQGTRWVKANPAWNIMRIGEVASERSVRNADLSTDAVLSCSKHHGFLRSSDYFGRTVHSADLSNYKVVLRNEFGFPSNHIEEGSIGLQNVVDAGAVSPIYTVFAFDEARIYAKFAILVLKSKHYAEMFRASTSATVDRRGSLRWKQFSTLPFPVPPMTEQKRISDIAASMDDELNHTRALLSQMETQKRGLMQQLLTGKIRVNVDEGEAASV
ncbi:restriction endonuclease subunit S [Arthrobacter sp. HY1533]|uniref:restriction endonuclease subunit S n=1 Tax=Arthrobacter sp. HY1533 TaxID=2970919 RepID=UPI0022B9DC28|nr:restriction endonuclease subunit S [Arthrobacter sp. HY1533]